jgi:hypothetical protein
MGARKSSACRTILLRLSVAEWIDLLGWEIVV